MGTIRPTAAPLKLVSCSTSWASCRIFSVTGNPILFDTLNDLQGKLSVFLSAGRLRREGEDGLLIGGTFLQAHVFTNPRFEQDRAKHRTNLLVRIAGAVRALIVKRDHHAENLQRGIRARAAAFIGLAPVAGPLEGEVSRLHG